MYRESEVRRYFEPVPNPVYNIDLNDSIAPSLYNQKQPNNGSQVNYNGCGGGCVYLYCSYVSYH